MQYQYQNQTLIKRNVKRRCAYLEVIFPREKKHEYCLGGRLWRSLSAFLSAILSGFTLLSAFLSAQKSKTTQKRALKSKYAFLSAQKRAQTSGFAQNSAQLRSFAQKRAQLSGPLKKALKRGEELLKRGKRAQ